MSSGKTVCKEVCSKCKCIVKEKILDDNNKDKKCKDDAKKDCTATIVGVITLPDNMCNCGDDKKSEEDNKCEDEKDECVDVYRDLGECLQKAIVKVSCDNKGRNDDC